MLHSVEHDRSVAQRNTASTPVARENKPWRSKVVRMTKAKGLFTNQKGHPSPSNGLVTKAKSEQKGVAVKLSAISPGDTLRGHSVFQFEVVEWGVGWWGWFQAASSAGSEQQRRLPLGQ